MCAEGICVLQICHFFFFFFFERITERGVHFSPSLSFSLFFPPFKSLLALSEFLGDCRHNKKKKKKQHKNKNKKVFKNQQNLPASTKVGSLLRDVLCIFGG